MKTNLQLLADHLGLPEEIIEAQENGGGVSLTHSVSLDEVLEAMREAQEQTLDSFFDWYEKEVNGYPIPKEFITKYFDSISQLK